MMSDTRNKATLAKMQRKNELLQMLISDTEAKIKNFSKPNNKEYQTLIKNLIIEVIKMIKLYSRWSKC